MASSKKVVQDRRVALPIGVGGGMYRSGDWAKMPPDATPYAKNVFIRPGPRVEKRDGWLRDATIPFNPVFTTAWHRILRFDNSSGTQQLLLTPYGSGSGVWFDGAAWHSDANIALATTDYTELNGVMYAIQSGSIWSFDGATVTADAAKSGIGGNTICAHKSRLFVGALVEQPTNQLTTAAYRFENAADWTLAGGPPTVVNSGGIRKLTIVNAADTIKTTAAAYTSGASEEYVTLHVRFRAYDASQNLPFTITIEDAAGATIYGALELFVRNRTVQPDWQTFIVQARIPAATAVYIKYKPGNTSMAAVLGSADVADENNALHQVLLTKGRRVFGDGTGASFNSFFGSYTYPQRLAWCEVNDPTYWRAASFYDCVEVPGNIQLMRSDGDRLYAFKQNAIWVFATQDNPSLPIVLVNVVRNVGIVNPQGFVTFKGIMYFIGLDEIYAWTGDGEPTPLCGDAMRETLFNSSTVSSPCIAVNQRTRELYCYLQPGKIHTLNLAAQNKPWSFITLTGANDAELTINDMTCATQALGADQELYVTAGQSVDLVRLHSGQTVDNITGTERNVTAEYWFRPLQTKEPRYTFLIESMEIDHGMTAAQDSATTTFELSYDGGQTFPSVNNIHVAPLAGGNYQPLQVPLWQSHERLIVGLKHVGPAGPSYFNFSGGTAMMQILGEKIQRSNPTAI